MALRLWAVVLGIAAASGAGGVAVGEGAVLQRSAEAVQPAPESAGRDRGQLFADGCFVDQSQLRFPACAYGERFSKTTVVLYGDSQAMQWFPALQPLVESRGWRLVGRLRAGCPPASVHFSHRCDSWREGTLRRIARHDRPRLVVVGSGSAYRVIAGGRRLSSAGSQARLAAGYARTLRRLRATGASVAVIKATPWSPRDVPDCVARQLAHLRRCAFARRQPTNRRFDARAAARVEGATLVDPTDAVCLPRLCPAVIDDLLVYRDAKHFSATFARTLAPWFGERLSPYLPSRSAGGR